MLISYIQNAMKLANYEILEDGHRQTISKLVAKNCKGRWKIGLCLAYE